MSQQNGKKTIKGPLCYQKLKCSFLDYVQLLMLSDLSDEHGLKHKTNDKRPPKSLKNKMFDFWITFNF